MASMRDYKKSVRANKKYGFDWEPWLDGSTIASASWTVTPNDLSMGVEANTSTLSTIFLSGGEIGEKYKIAGTIVTGDAEPETESKYFTITVED